MAAQSKPLGSTLAEWIRTKSSAKYSIVVILALLYFLRDRLLSTRKSKQKGRPRLSKRVSSYAKQGKGNLINEVVRRNRQPISEEEMDAALEELYVENKDGTYDLLVPHRHRISRVNIKTTSQKTFDEHWKDFKVQPPIVEKKRSSNNSSGENKELISAEQKIEEARTLREEGGAAAASAKKVGVNREFFRQLRAIFKILIPTSSSKEVLIFFIHTGFLILRTYLSVLVARLDGAIVRDLVSANGKGFLRGLGFWFLLAVPSTYTNSMVSGLAEGECKYKSHHVDPPSPFLCHFRFDFSNPSSLLASELD